MLTSMENPRLFLTVLQTGSTLQAAARNLYFYCLLTGSGSNFPHQEAFSHCLFYRSCSVCSFMGTFSRVPFFGGDCWTGTRGLLRVKRFPLFFKKQKPVFPMVSAVFNDSCDTGRHRPVSYFCRAVPGLFFFPHRIVCARAFAMQGELSLLLQAPQEPASLGSGDVQQRDDICPPNFFLLSGWLQEWFRTGT